jgi:RNA polymerase sigma-70 factor, ECF subfamily
MNQPAETVGDAPTPSDHSLLRDVRRGDDSAATHLYRRYGQRLLALVRAKTSTSLSSRIDADDVVQSVFRTFFLRVRDGHYDVPRGEDLWGLLLSIALSKLRDQEQFHRAAKRDVRLTVPLQVEGPGAPGQGGEDGDDVFFQLVVREAFAGLPELHRAVIELRLAGHDVAAIAAHTGRSRRTVERVLQDVRGRLTTLLGLEKGDCPSSPTGHSSLSK